jgi:hypothetical protein
MRLTYLFELLLSDPSRENVKRSRRRPVLKYLKAGFLDTRDPPFPAAGTAMREQWSEGKLHPPVIRYQDQQKISSGLNNPGGLSQRLLDPFAIQVIDRIGTYNCIEARSFEGKLAHVGSFDCGSLLDARRFQVPEQSLLWTSFPAEVHVKRVAEKI